MVITSFNLFPTWRRFLKQTTFKYIVANGETAHNKHFLHLPQCFQLYFVIIKLSFEYIFNIFFLSVFKVGCCKCVVCGKGLKKMLTCVTARFVLFVVSWRCLPSRSTLMPFGLIMNALYKTENPNHHDKHNYDNCLI